MKKELKKEVEKTLDAAMSQVFEKLEIAKPSNKTRRAISKVSKRIKRDLAKHLKKAVRKISKSKSKRTPVKTSEHAHLTEK
jgi:hypothetical protein